MPKQITAYDLLISCPPDIETYISSIELAADRFNKDFGRLNDMIVRTAHFPRDFQSMTGKSPQALSNQQIIDTLYTFDLVIGIFGNKLDTPTKEYGLRAEEEIEYIISKEKRAFLYFLDVPVLPSQFNSTQYAEVCNFKKRHKEIGIRDKIEGAEKLSGDFYQQLTLHFNSIFQGPAFKEQHKKRNILWVDDRPENNVYERTALERYGLEFTLALSTEQALSNLHTHKFSLVISDMGRKDGPREGFTLLNELRKIDRAIPFIAYTSSQNPEQVKQILDQGGQGHTTNPTELVNLVLQNLLRAD